MPNAEQLKWRVATELRDLPDIKPDVFREHLEDAVNQIGREEVPRPSQFNCRLPSRSLMDLRLIAKYHRLSQSEVVELLLLIAKQIGLVPELEEHHNAK